jgi:uncharacterized membrane protein
MGVKLALTLREENRVRVFESRALRRIRVRVFESRALRRIFGPNRDAVTGEWRKLHNEELHDLYSSPIIIRIIKSRRMRWAGHVCTNGGEEELV